MTGVWRAGVEEGKRRRRRRRTRMREEEEKGGRRCEELLGGPWRCEETKGEMSKGGGEGRGARVGGDKRRRRGEDARMRRVEDWTTPQQLERL